MSENFTEHNYVCPSRNVEYYHNVILFCYTWLLILVSRNGVSDAPPPYAAPPGPFFQAPPPAYSPAPAGYYGWVPNVAAFPNAPPGICFFYFSIFV